MLASTPHPAARGIAAPIWPAGMPACRIVDRDQEFMGLLAAFRATGGLATGAELAARDRDAGTGRLARWIVQREVLGFDWQGSLWLPAFQFDRRLLALAPDARRVARELPRGADGWDLAQWWVAPNALLALNSPLALLEVDVDAVAEAARAFRFVMAG